MASGDAAREAVKQRTQRGSSGLPKGVTKSGKKYQARINYRPEGKVKKELRGLGSFDSVEQAVQAVAAARAALNDGEDPFKHELAQRQARGQVRSPTSPVAGPLICSCLHTEHICHACLSGTTARAQDGPQVGCAQEWAVARVQRHWAWAGRQRARWKIPEQRRHAGVGQDSMHYKGDQQSNNGSLLHLGASRERYCQISRGAKQLIPGS